MYTYLICNNDKKKGLEALAGKKPSINCEVIGYGYMFISHELFFEGALELQTISRAPQSTCFILEGKGCICGCALAHDVFVSYKQEA